MKNYKPALYHSTVGFSKTNRIVPSSAVMYQIKNGKPVIIARDVYVPNLLPVGKDVVK